MSTGAARGACNDAAVLVVTHLCVQSEFCGDKPKSGSKYGLPDSLTILSEMGEVTDGVMDNKVKSSRALPDGLATER